MILRAAERDRGRAVAQREERYFLADKAFLDHDLGAGRAERAREHHVDGGLRVLDCLCDHDALAGREPVRLHDDRRTLFGYVAFRRLGGGETPVGGRGNAGATTEVLGEALGAFQPRGGFRRPERLDAGRFKVVDNAGRQRRLGPHDDEIDLVVAAECDHGPVVGGVNRHKLRLLRDAGIARRTPQPVDERAGGKLPGQRVFTAAAAEQKNIHSACRLWRS